MKKELNQTAASYTMNEVSAKIGISRAFILKMIRTGKLKAQKVNNQWVFTEESINAFVAENHETILDCICR